jgi:hypothetical protein
MNVLVVIPPATSWSATRGLRHAIIAGAERTLCGKVAENWQGEATTRPVPFESAHVGCRTCIRVHNAMNG